MRMKCKSPGCPGHVEVDVDDKVVGNFRISRLHNDAILVTAEDAIPDDKTIGLLKIVQPEHAELKRQVVMFQKNKQGKVFHTDRFFLTCDAVPSHTLPYDIKIEDA